MGKQGFREITQDADAVVTADAYSHLCKDRNLIERFFNRIKQFRRIATRRDKCAANVLASLKLACVRIWLRGHEATAQDSDRCRHRRTGASDVKRHCNPGYSRGVSTPF
ncbi:MAG: hypothetical protein B7Z40_01090 [Bosea sp. 12-68-7]|nr:MAG: hypothetical protein B7Z40_01090 [Bosea sp. 12-68-7]OYW98287.1 MAG: hypothetical protein B7Z14_15290 [Bosea sp. 32-68-6]